MNWCSRFIRQSFVVTLIISLIIAAVILGLDIDLLKNGPYYASMLIFKIMNKDGNSKVSREEIMINLEEIQQSLWVHIPMLVLVFLCSLVIFMSIVGLLGAYFLSYSIMAGYAMFHFITCLFLGIIILYVFLNNMKNTVSNAYMEEKILQYNSNSSFNLIIDFIQRDLECCGFRNPQDWDVYPMSCCPKNELAEIVQLVNCTDGSCETTTCTEELAYTQSCLSAARKHFLDPSSFVGFLGIGLIAAAVVLTLNLVLSFILCLITRHRRRKEWRTNEVNLDDTDEDYSRLVQSVTPL